MMRQCHKTPRGRVKPHRLRQNCDMLKDKIAALEDKIANMRAQLEAAQRRELWLQGQIDQIQQRLLPPPRQGIIERIAEAMARMR